MECIALTGRRAPPRSRSWCGASPPRSHDGPDLDGGSDPRPHRRVHGEREPPDEALALGPNRRCVGTGSASVWRASGSTRSRATQDALTTRRRASPTCSFFFGLRGPPREHDRSLGPRVLPPVPRRLLRLARRLPRRGQRRRHPRRVCLRAPERHHQRARHRRRVDVHLLPRRPPRRSHDPVGRRSAHPRDHHHDDALPTSSTTVRCSRWRANGTRSRGRAPTPTWGNRRGRSSRRSSPTMLGKPLGVHWYAPAASLISFGLESVRPKYLIVLAHAGFWAHASLVLIFLNILPYSKHFHIITAIPNVFFRNLEKPGRLPLVAHVDGGAGRYGREGGRRCGRRGSGREGQDRRLHVEGDPRLLYVHRMRSLLRQLPGAQDRQDPEPEDAHARSARSSWLRSRADESG